MRLSNILKRIEERTGLVLHPFHLDKPKGIYYRYYSLMDDGITRQDKLEITIRDCDLLSIEEKDELIRAAILETCDTTDYLSAELAGGGIEQSEDFESIDKLLIYIIKIRSDL